MTKTNEPHNRHDLPVKKPYQTHPAQRAKLSMIATPIGNLSDLSDRARESLLNVDELWCEDTRHTQALLSALKIEKKRLKRVDQHTDEKELRRLLSELESSGQWIGVVTDAGTPGLSDPGASLVALISDYPGIKLEPIPGPSALSTFISIAGFSGNSFTFQGFFPRSDSEALQLLNTLKDEALVQNHIFFESPHRILNCLSILEEWCKDLEFTPHFVFAKELSKLHETIFQGQGLSFLQELRGQGFDERGEWVLGIGLPIDCVKNKKVEANWELTLECLIQAGISTKDASQIVMGRFSVAKNLAYKAALELSKKNKK